MNLGRCEPETTRFDPLSTPPDSQFHFVTNLYAGDAAVLPTCGSANPVMNGVAIRRRLARRLVPQGDGALPLQAFVQYPPPSAPPSAGTVTTLFDGSSLANDRRYLAMYSFRTSTGDREPSSISVQLGVTRPKS